MQIPPLQHPEDTTLPFSGSHPAACPVSGHFKARLLQLAPGWSSSAGHQALQLVQNAAARLIFNLPKFTHVTPLLRSLHWLPVAARLRFKTLMLAYKAKNGPAPLYLMAMVKSRAVPRALRASSTARLEPPSLRTHGRQASRLFSVLAPRWWNELPLGVRTAESLTVFKRRLKTHLFVMHLTLAPVRAVSELVCSIYFANSPPCSDKSRIAFVVSLLIGKALDWATAVWPSYERGTYEDFIKDFKAVFDHPNEGTGWNEPALLTAFRHGLHMDIRKELAYSTRWPDPGGAHLTRYTPGSAQERSESSTLESLPPDVPGGSPATTDTTIPAPTAGLARSTPELSPEEPMQVDTSTPIPRVRDSVGCAEVCACTAVTRGHILRKLQPASPKESTVIRQQAGQHRSSRAPLPVPPLNFSSVAAPLTSLLKGNAKRLVWNPQAGSAFEELKRRFTTAPLLQHPDPTKPFVVEVDASNVGVGAVLSQRSGEPPKLRPVAYFSHKLSPAERNYGIGDKELLAIKLAFDEWRHWLEDA
ncbi:hypothetical protein NFI96_001184, partial [Prochilodus magdalenae]